MILTDETIRQIKIRMARYPSRRSAILPALTAAYKQVGHLNPAIYREIARVMDIPYIEIAEAASFYTMFPKHEVGRYLIQVCHNISCSLRGADNLIAYIEQKLGIALGETTPDKLFTLIAVECLGGCATAPTMQINDTYYENLTRARVDEIIADLRAKEEQDNR
ncbi:MAG: NAD(P)H-dependent oxidoreductase subunit E [candidate division Zixibacteria bacterium]|nr:NAD(P)H-dependent oxidoreductase subunit E [candidate division Zixibacteria bacterium]